MTDAPKPNLLIELLITLVIPSLILMKLSDPARLGAVNALLLALAFPLFWGVRDFLTRRKLNLFAALGVISILLTGFLDGQPLCVQLQQANTAGKQDADQAQRSEQVELAPHKKIARPPGQRESQRQQQRIDDPQVCRIA